MKKVKFLFGICLMFLMLGKVSADDHIFSLRYMADPWTMEYNGRLYIFASHDRYEPGTQYNSIKDIVCISTDDMKNWTDHGEVFSIRDSKWGAKLTWAPSVVERNGKFYLYYSDGMERIGVAISDSPTGPYIDNHSGPIVDKNTPGVGKGGGRWGMWCFDPSVLIDDDGQAYMYFGGSSPENSRIIKLKANMIEVDGAAVKANTPGFFEASFVHKYKGKYYYSYSGHHYFSPSSIEYVTSDKPMEGFDNVKVAMRTPPVNDGFNHHQSIFEFKGNWYMAYHNRQLAVENGIEDRPAREFMRSLCIDYLYHNEDGSIKEVIPTKDGLKQLKYINPFQWNEAETMAWSHGGLNTQVFEGGRYLNQITNGSWIQVKGVDFGNGGAKEFKVRVASSTVGGFLEVRLGSPSGKTICRLAFGNTGGGEQWKEITGKVEEIKGIQDVYFVFHGDMGELFTFDKWKFEPNTNGFACDAGK